MMKLSTLIFSLFSLLLLGEPATVLNEETELIDVLSSLKLEKYISNFYGMNLFEPRYLLLLKAMDFNIMVIIFEYLVKLNLDF